MKDFQLSMITWSFIFHGDTFLIWPDQAQLKWVPTLQLVPHRPKVLLRMTRIGKSSGTLKTECRQTNHCLLSFAAVRHANCYGYFWVSGVCFCGYHFSWYTFKIYGIYTNILIYTYIYITCTYRSHLYISVDIKMYISIVYVDIVNISIDILWYTHIYTCVNR
jgi:hypothetical protein